jgi:flagellar hook-length control protein FliK
MDTSLSTIDRMLFSTAALAAPCESQRFACTREAELPEQRYADHCSGPPEYAKTDNSPPSRPDESVSAAKQNFNQTLRRKVDEDSIKKSQKNNVTDMQRSASEPSADASPEQSVSDRQTAVACQASVQKNASEIKPKAGRLAELTANVKDGKSSVASAQETNRNKQVSAADKSRTGFKIALSVNSKDKLIADAESESSVTTSLPNNGTEAVKTAAAQDLEEHTSTARAFAEKNTHKALNKDIIPASPTPGEPHTSKSSDQSGRISEIDILANSQYKTAEEDAALKSATTIDEKASKPNANFAKVQNKFVRQASQSTEAAPDRPATNDERTSLNKTSNPHIISESSESDIKEISDPANKLSDKSAVRELNITHVKVSINQTENGNSTTNSNHSQPQQSLTPDNSETAVPTQPSASAQGANTLNTPAPTSTAANSTGVGKQIFESVHSSFSHETRDQQITVQLNPPELGKVMIKFQEQDRNIIGLLEVSKTQTRIEIEQAIPQIIKDLQDSGIQIKRMDVVLSQQEQPQHGALREQTLPNGSNQQQGSQDSYHAGPAYPDAAEINEWLVNNDTLNDSEWQGAIAGTGSINMLI